MPADYEDPSTWRLQTNGGIPYRIVAMDGGFEAERADCSMTILIPANKLVEYALEAFPAPTFSGVFPIYPARGKINGYPLYANRIRWKAHLGGKPVDPFGIDPFAPSKTYQPNVELTVEFSTDIDVGAGSSSDPDDPFTFLEVSCSGAGEFIHSTSPNAKWLDQAGAVVQEKNRLQSTPINILVPEVEWDVNWPRVPNVFYKNTLVSRLRNALGRVNSTAMTVLMNAPAETILFVGYSMRQQYTWRTATQPPFQMNLKFVEKYLVDDNGTRRGHNDFWKADIGDWFRLEINGKPVYKRTDLNALFKP